MGLRSFWGFVTGKKVKTIEEVYVFLEEDGKGKERIARFYYPSGTAVPLVATTKEEMVRIKYTHVPELQRYGAKISLVKFTVGIRVSL